MNTDFLIAKLSAELRPVRAGAVPATLRGGLLAGGVAALVLLVIVPALAVRPDLQEAAATAPFWMKLAYTVMLGGLGLLGLLAVAKPGEPRPVWKRLLGPAPLLLAMVVVFTWLTAATPATSFWMGSSWRVCPLLIAALSLPVLAATLVALRRLAPTRLGEAGAAAGLVAGALAATVYQLHCNESSPGFVLIWYSLGIAIPAAAGALIGPRVLKW